jgi:ubiquinone/menaquinone biosynthesis C-methylase UbiE
MKCVQTSVEMLKKISIFSAVFSPCYHKYIMDENRELAYRYDLFVTPDWRDRFDTLINEQLKLPTEGRLLDVNSGTGAHAIEIASRMREKGGEVVGIDPSPQRIELARAKAQVIKIDNVRFEEGGPTPLPFANDEFDVVIGDASMAHVAETEPILAEMVRVARPGAPVILKVASRGSFDEFFSIYWQALFGAGLADEVWDNLESLVNERWTVSDTEAMAERAGLKGVESYSSKEEFDYETGAEFVQSPLIKDCFLNEWLAIVPEDRRQFVSERIVETIEEERHDTPFDISIKATLVAGKKRVS